jgi:hypothetical protein
VSNAALTEISLGDDLRSIIAEMFSIGVSTFQVKAGDIILTVEKSTELEDEERDVFAEAEMNDSGLAVILWH